MLEETHHTLLFSLKIVSLTVDSVQSNLNRLKTLDSRFVAVTVTDRVPLEVGVAIFGGKSVDNMRTVVMCATAAVRLCKMSCEGDDRNS